MIQNLVWNGITGKIERFFIRNTGNTELTIDKLYIRNENDFVSTSNVLDANTSDFNHTYYPWKFLPETLSYSNNPPISNLDVREGFIYGNIEPLMLEVFPSSPASQTVNPLHYPSFNSGYYIWPSGLGITQPLNNLYHTNQSQLYGQNVRDYYRLPNKVTLAPYDTGLDPSGHQISIVVACHPLVKGSYKGSINIDYTYINPYGETKESKLSVNLTAYKVFANFQELDKTADTNIFSLEGVSLEGRTISIQ